MDLQKLYVEITQSYLVQAQITLLDGDLYGALGHLREAVRRCDKGRLSHDLESFIKGCHAYVVELEKELSEARKNRPEL